MSDGRPDVSVIVPTYNAAAYIEEATGSALAQTLSNIEVLVFDNASTDDTPARMRGIEDPRLVYSYHERNVGFCGNVTRGLKVARGRYVMVLGADDVLEPDFLSSAVARMDAAPEAALLHGGATWIDSNGSSRGGFTGRWPERCDGAEAFALCFEEGFCFSTVLCRGDDARALAPMPEEWGAISDTWLFVKLCLRGDALFLPEAKVRYRVHEKSLSFELYADGQMYRDHLRGLRDALAWPEAKGRGIDQARVEAAVGREALATLHLAHLGAGRAAALGQFREVVSMSPRLALEMKSWARLGFAMTPRRLIEAMRARRAKRRLAEGAT